MLTGWADRAGAVAGRCGFRRRAVVALVSAAAMAVSGCASQAGGPSSPRSVEAPVGRLVGAAENGVAVYKGIPYAVSTAGERRWTQPEAFPDWEGQREAVAFGPACPQPAPRPGGIYFSDVGQTSEDCLSLNVWAPEGAENVPVFVWIHGGSLTGGAGSEAMYDGARMARQQGLVVVTLNYRLGVLGYLAHPELSAETAQNASGNYGLMDQILALQWVKRNIAAFGGDPEKVTLAGESAGALSVALLMTSPKAEGLFDRAILQSAYLVTMAALKEPVHGMPSAEAVGAAMVAQSGAADIAELRKMPAGRLVDLGARTGFFPFGVVDGEYITDQMISVFDRGEQAQVPVLAGFNEGEIRSLRFLLPPVPGKAESYEAAIRAGYADLADRFLTLYPSDRREASMLAATRDAMYGWTAERLSVSQTAQGHPSYFYLFDHSYPAADRMGLRAFHAAEIPYVFGTLSEAVPPWPEIPRTQVERTLSDTMMDYWASFARNGRPVSDTGPDWPAYGEAANGMVFTAQPEPWPKLSRERFELHEEVICRRRMDGTIPWNWNVGIVSPPIPPEEQICK